MATQVYGDKTGTGSTIGTQIRTDFYQKKALIEARKLQFFGQLADVTAMPKNMGKTIKLFHYLPMLDDANINDQGIDANSVSTSNEVTIIVNGPGAVSTSGKGIYFVGTDTATTPTAAAALVIAQAKVVSWVEKSKLAGGLGLTTTGATPLLKYTDATTNAGTTFPLALGYTFTVNTAGVNSFGNLYGSSKDVGYIVGKLPALGETGGRVNRVGFKRVSIEATLQKMGFFDEYTQESLDFDTDSELSMHINREMLNGAQEITEDALQIDLLNGAGVIRFGGAATSTAELSGNTGSISEITYKDLMRMEVDLDNNRCPKSTTIISGTRMVDTATIAATRYMYVGSELSIMLKTMVDEQGTPVFIPAHKYAAAGNLVNGEIGKIAGFTIIVVPEMMYWAGKGATVGTGATANAGYRETGGKYDVFPMLVVGSGSFTTIGFQTDGKSVKFKIFHKKPGEENATTQDPYGETGFMSIKWYYATMILRPERIALAKTVASW
jgi:N4-gp56 family major capsid protein